MYDVFISYNRADAAHAQEFSHALRRQDLTVFFDQDELLPGGEWRTEVEDALKASRSVALLRGRNGTGPTQEKEEKLALDHQSNRKELLIFNVILPGAETPKTPTFAGLNTYVDLSSGIDKLTELGRIRLALEKAAKKKRPPPPSPPDPDPALALTEMNDAIDALERRVGQSHVMFLIGHELSPTPPSTGDMAIHLTELLKKNDPTIPEVSSLDVAGSYYAADCNDDLAAEAEIRKLIEESAIGNGETAYDELANVIATLVAKFRPKAGDGAQGPEFTPARWGLLLVCTHFDLGMERALIRAGISFRRIVQFTSEPRVDVSNYSVATHGDTRQVTVSGHDGSAHAPEMVGRNNPAEMNDVIGLPVEPVRFTSGARSQKVKNPLETLPMIAPDAPRGLQVVLYKPFGSQDRIGSCAISCDHYYRFALRSVPDRQIPAQIVEAMQNAPIVVLGSSLFDPSYRVTYHALLSRRLSNEQVYVIRRRPPRPASPPQQHIESALWADVPRAWQRAGAHLIDVSEHVFLKALGQRFLEKTRR